MTNKQLADKVHKALDQLKQTEVGYPGPGKGTYWAPAMKSLREVEAELRPSTPPVTPRLVFPFPTEAKITICQGLHETGGVGGNWAIDFCCHPGQLVLAPERATITRFSGHDPNDDTADSLGVFGWTTYFVTPAGYVYFLTHQGKRLPTLKVGMRVEPGDQLGWAGDQSHRPDHIHLGVSSPHGEADAKKRILAVSKAPRIH